MPVLAAEPDARLVTGRYRAPVRNALTIDVEDYYHVSAFETLLCRSQWPTMPSRVATGTRLLLDILAKHQVRATFFVLGWVAEHHPALVRAIAAAGHEIGCHSYWHRLVYRQTPEEFRTDLRRARAVIEDVTGQPVRAYRAPCFSITRRSLWALDILIEEQFQFDSSIFPTYHDRYGLAGAPLVPHSIRRSNGTLQEFPLTVYRLCGYPLPVGGGGYLRLYPYRFTRHALRAINAQGRPAAIYLHPWELDPQQPRLAVGRINTFRHYVNLHRTQERLEQLLHDFPLGTLSEALAQPDLPTWDPGGSA